MDEHPELYGKRNYAQIVIAALAIIGTTVLMIYFFVFATPRPGAQRPIVTPGEPIIAGIAAPESTIIVRFPESRIKLTEPEMAVKEAVFHLKIPSAKREGAFGNSGSGFLVAPDTVATAAHVIPDGYDGKVLVYCVRREDGLTGSVEGSVLDADPERDVALVAVTGCSEVEPVTIAEEAPGPNEMLDAFGYSIAEGIGIGIVDVDRMTCSFIPGADLAAGVRSLGGRDDWAIMVSPHLVGITGVVQRGNSGGPVCRRSDGAVVGMISAHEPYLERSFMSPAASIREMMDRNGL